MTANAVALSVLFLLWGAILRSLPLLAVAAVTLLCLRRSSAVLRHLVLLLTLGGLLCLPLLSAVLPAWHVSLPSRPTTVPIVPRAPSPAIADTASPALPLPPYMPTPVAALPDAPAQAVVQSPALSWRVGLVTVWLVGAAASLVPLLMGLVAVGRLQRRCVRPSDGELTALARHCAGELGLRRPITLLQGSSDAESVVPMTWGWLRPIVLLPAGAEAWSYERQRVVLLHEMAHVRRGDWPGQILAHIVCAFYWFHPGVWLLARQLRIESERACDEMVLAAGVPAPEYARQLLELIRVSQPSHVPLPALPMAQRLGFEKRINMILRNDQHSRPAPRHAKAALALTAALVILPISLLRPTASAQARAATPGINRLVDGLPIVIVDAGHGGGDTGALAPDGTREKDLNLAIALKLRDALAEQGANALMTRTTDVSLSQRGRSQVAITDRAGMLISVHCDNRGVPNAHRGIFIYYHGHSAVGLRLASDVSAALTHSTRVPVSGVLTDMTRFPQGFGVLRGCPAAVPAILVECGFLNNAQDLADLRQTQTQQQIAEGIAAGVSDFVTSDKPHMTMVTAQGAARAKAAHAVPGKLDISHLMPAAPPHAMRSSHSGATQFHDGLGVLSSRPSPPPAPAILAVGRFPNNTQDTAGLSQTQAHRQIAQGVAARVSDFVTTGKSYMTRATAQVSAVHALSGKQDPYSLLSDGSTLTAEQAKDLESELAARPEDLSLHIKLLGYYSASQFRSPSARVAFQTQLFWLIQNDPESVLASLPELTLLKNKKDSNDAFDHGKALWLAQVARHPGNTTILGNAANYCLLSDSPTAERLLKQAEEAEPKKAEWPAKLGELYQLQESDQHGLRPDYREWAQKAQAQYERIVGPLTQNSNVDLLARLAKAAYDAGDYATAQAAGQRLMDFPSTDKQSVGVRFTEGEGDDAIHQGNMILGRLALRNGDVEQAKSRLLAMGQVSGTSTLTSFGPNMQLAQDLLEHGERQVVVQYFDECAKFWKHDYGQLAQWKAQVQQGQRPDFSANLVY